MADRKHFSIVVDSDDNPYGPFETMQSIAEFTAKMWPGIAQRDGDAPGWDVWTLIDPEWALANKK